MGEIRSQLENYIKPGGVASWLVGVSWATYEIVLGEGRASVLSFCLIFILGPAFYRRGGNGSGASGAESEHGASPAIPDLDDPDPSSHRVISPLLGLLT